MLHLGLLKQCQGDVEFPLNILQVLYIRGDVHAIVFKLGRSKDYGFERYLSFRPGTLKKTTCTVISSRRRRENGELKVSRPAINS